MARLRLFASARELAGTRDDDLPGDTVAEVLEAAVARYGAAFAGVLESATIWCNGETVALDHRVTDADEVAVLPPVSGGSVASAPGR
jgi:sulfur-carrier protein